MIFGRRYRVTERIGSGGMADVYKAVDETLGRTVAVKVMHAHYAADPDYVARFRQEAAAAANLSHPSIVNIYDFGVEGTPYIVMELVRGTDLKAVLRQRGVIDPTQVAEYGAQVCSALGVAHGYGIIHRDIKPQNVVLQPDGRVKVMDFGIARAVDSDATQTGSVLGTAQYVSPEQAQGRVLGPQTDLYSLGVVLYELSTGRLPFDGDTPVSVALKHVNDAPVPPRQLRPEIPPALEAVILKAMTKDPAHRYRSADEMRDDLLRVAAGRPVSAQARVDDTSVMPAVERAGRVADVRRTPERRGTSPWVWVGIVALLLALGLGVVWAMTALSPGIKVPDTTKMTLAEAKAAIIQAELTVGNVDSKPDDTAPKDTVLSTDPPAGDPAEKGQAIDIVVSAGPQLLPIPDVTGMPKDSAIATLQAGGFDVDAMITEEFNAKVKAGAVIRQDPPADTPMPKGTKVKLWVSKGAETAGVPYVIDKSKADAISDLQKAGFTVKSVDKSNGEVAKGTVFDQSPAGGGLAAKGSEVTIYVSSGPKQVSVPVLKDLTQAEAVAKLTAAGLNANVQSLTDADPTKTGKVQDQDPSGGTKVNEGATVTIWVAKLP
ncbi:MAG: Stk1 family PASTA domain-containing Ser/Thr kinase [Coriobacteriia bacterium]|nr:Stk1 family PASTA domain-containing Ser/Thr kinase [Coriobacteriia bacterium]